MTTLSQVAQRAGVTSATVSNVLRQRGKVGEETRARVLAAIEALGYRPHLTARALADLSADDARRSTSRVDAEASVRPSPASTTWATM